MHTYRQSEQNLWTVGFEMPNPDTTDWRPMRDFNTESEAAAYVSFLNGGENPKKPWPAETV